MLTLEDHKVISLRNQVHAYAVSLKTCCAELLQRIRSVRLRDPNEYRRNCSERERLEGLLDTLIDFLAAEEQWMNEEDGNEKLQS